MTYHLAKWNRQNRNGNVPKWTLYHRDNSGKQKVLRSWLGDTEHPPTEALLELERLNNSTAPAPTIRGGRHATLPSFADFVPAYRADYKRDLKRGAVSARYYKREMRFCDWLTEIYGEWTAEHFFAEGSQTLVAEKFDSKWGACGISVRRAAKGAFNRICRKAVAEGAFVANPAAAITIKAQKHKRTQAEVEAEVKKYIYDRSYVRALVDAAVERFDWCYGILIAFYAYTGVQPAEALGLSWRNCNLDQKYVHIIFTRRPCLDDNDDIYWDTLEVKNVKSDGTLPKRVRKIPIVPELHDLLLSWKLASPFSQGDDYVFPLKDGEPQKGTDHVRGEYWKDFEESFRAEYNERVNPANRTSNAICLDDFRHYYATLLLIQFGDEWHTLADLMGHESTDFTRKQYARTYEELQASGELQQPPVMQQIASGGLQL